MFFGSKKEFFCVLPLCLLIASCSANKKSGINKNTEEVPVVPSVTIHVSEPHEVLYFGEDSTLSTAQGDGGLGIDFDSQNKLEPYKGIPTTIDWSNVASSSKRVVVSASGDPLCSNLFAFEPGDNLIHINVQDLKSLLVCEVAVEAFGSYQDRIINDKKTFEVAINPTFAVYAKNNDSTFRYLKAYTGGRSNATQIAKWLKDTKTQESGLKLKYDPEIVKDGTNIENINALIGAQSIRSIDVSGTNLRDVKAFSYLKNLQKINVSGTKVEAARDLSVFEGLAFLESLVINNLHLKDIKSVTDHLTNLVELDISNNDQIDDLENIQNLKKLRILKASNIGLSNFKKFENMVQVTDLDISKNDFSHMGSEDAQDLAYLHGLEALNVSASHLKDEFLNSYFEIVAPRRILRKFVDENTFDKSKTVTKETCRSKINIFDDIPNLSKLSSLEYLSLSGNGCIVSIDAKSNSVFMGLTSTDLFSALPNLAYLDISNTPVKNVAALDKLYVLSFINIKNIMLTREACVQQLPHQHTEICVILEPGNRKQQEFTRPGNHSFVVPENVYSISVEGCSGGDGGQGGQGGQGGFSGMSIPYRDTCPIELKSYSESGRTAYYCMSSTLPALGNLGARGGVSSVSNLFATTQDRSDTSHNGFCSGGIGGSGGNGGGVATGDWGRPKPSQDEEPKIGALGLFGANKKLTEQKNIPVLPGQILTVVVGSGGAPGAPTNGTKNAGCGFDEAWKKPNGDPRYCAGNGAPGKLGTSGTGGYLKISWTDLN